MDESQKKAIKLGVIVVCLVTAGVVTWSWTSKSPTGIDTIDPAVITWVKCRNPAFALHENKPNFTPPRTH